MYNGTRLVFEILSKFSEFDMMAAVIDMPCYNILLVFFVLISVAKFLIGK